jgi:hypothetical protein
MAATHEHDERKSMDQGKHQNRKKKGPMRDISPQTTDGNVRQKRSELEQDNIINGQRALPPIELISKKNWCVPFGTQRVEAEGVSNNEQRH